MYIFETILPDSKSIYFTLNKIFGVGKTQSKDFCKKLGFSHNLKLKELKPEQLKKLQQIIDFSSLKITADLLQNKRKNNQHLLSIRTARGIRRKKGLPVRGQRTHTNSKTARKIRI